MDRVRMGFTFILITALSGGCDDTPRSADGGMDHVVPDGPGDAGIGQPFELVIRDPFAPPRDPLVGGKVESCSLYQQRICHNGKQRTCAVYDPAAKVFVESVHPLFHRALLFDRWYDLYHQPFGITAMRNFVQPTPVGTPESEWGRAERFSNYSGTADGAIWTGTALSAFVLRYRQTGTRADYARMEQKVRRVLSMFDVTGAPGHLARQYYVAFDPRAPREPTLLQQFFTDNSQPDHDQFPIDASKVNGLPKEFVTEFEGAQGKTWKGQAWVHADPSIDQYSGVTVGLGQAFDLLEDPELKKRIGHHVGCYLKSLVRIEIRNVQDSKLAREVVEALFTGGHIKLDPGDMDPSGVDTIVAYASRHLHRDNQDTFDRSCPAGMQIEARPHRVLDASSPRFMADFLLLLGDLRSTEKPKPNGLGHVYVNVRGSNAIQMMYLATLAWRTTGDEQYLDFLKGEILGRWRGLELADTASAGIAPTWCRSWYGDHIVMSPFWALLTMLGESGVRRRLEAVMDREFWPKRLARIANVKFDAIYAGELRPSIARGWQTAADRVRAVMENMGGNGGTLDEPRRAYSQKRQWVLANMPGGPKTVCPTERQRNQCEEGFEIFGLKLEGSAITHPCGEDAGECELSSGCAWAMARDPLPPALRPFTGYLWQHNPYKFGASFGGEGYEQSPGVDMIEGFWLSRMYGLLEAGRGQVLAWKVGGTCP